MQNNQLTGLKRKTTDKYYTSKNIVNKCIELVKEHIIIDGNDLCIEPSAGNGSFINSIKLIFKNHRFYDLFPEHSEIVKQDYLTFNYNFLKKVMSKIVKEPQSGSGRAGCPCQFNKIHIIGNPPFGRQSSLAIKFIKKSAEYCDSISFILPKSFKKNSLKKHFPLYFHLEHEYDLPENSFIVDNKCYNVPCVFQIWVKKNIHRKRPVKLVPNKYKFVKKEIQHDISFRRVGFYAGKIDIDTEKKSPQSHYFIKFDAPLTDELFDKLSNINYSCKDNTVGAKSIGKQELMKEFNKIF